jgi:hypothetical protein
MLRAIVPPSYKVQVTMGKNGPIARINSNNRHQQAQPTFKITKGNNRYLVSVTHP